MVVHPELDPMSFKEGIATSPGIEWEYNLDATHLNKKDVTLTEQIKFKYPTTGNTVD